MVVDAENNVRTPPHKAADTSYPAMLLWCNIVGSLPEGAWLSGVFSIHAEFVHVGRWMFFMSCCSSYIFSDHVEAEELQKAASWLVTKDPVLQNSYLPVNKILSRDDELRLFFGLFWMVEAASFAPAVVGQSIRKTLISFSC